MVEISPPPLFIFDGSKLLTLLNAGSYSLEVSMIDVDEHGVVAKIDWG